MKRLIKLFIPPIFLKIWRKFQNNPQGETITYQGIYGSFKEVLNDFSFTNQYNNDESLQEVREHAKIKYQRYETGLPPRLDWDNCRLNLFPAFIAHFEKKVSILDIGGGLGDSFVDLKYSCPNLQLDYHVYELPDVVAMGEEFQRKYPELNFVSEIESLTPDIVLFGSSLQYFEDYREVIEKTCELKPEYILLTDHPMGEVETFVCAQVNMKDRVIPRYVFNIQEITELFGKLSYQPILKSVNYYSFHNFHNYEGEYRNCEHYNLAFKRVARTE